MQGAMGRKTREKEKSLLVSFPPHNSLHPSPLVNHYVSFSSPEAALLLVSTTNRNLWPGPTPEVRDSRTSRHYAQPQSQV